MTTSEDTSCLFGIPSLRKTGVYWFAGHIEELYN